MEREDAGRATGTNNQAMTPPGNLPPSIQSVAVIGEGKMGSGILQYLLDFPFELIWICSPGADSDKIKRQLDRKIRRAIDSGSDHAQVLERHLSIPVSSDLGAAASCDLLIEAIPEDAALKRELFREADEIMNHAAIFASNSSSVIPSELSPEGDRKDRFIGLHFFYPVALKNIVEVTPTARTSPQTIELVIRFLNVIRRNHIQLDEANSFILNRIFLDVQNEACLLVNDGQCTVQQVDNLLKKHLFPFGVFDFCDSVGLDTMLASVQNYTRSYSDRDKYLPFIETLSSHVAAGRLGMKSGAGFYDFADPGAESNLLQPDLEAKIVTRLRGIWLESCHRMSGQAQLTVDEANHAIREYFDLTEGPL